MKPLHQAFLLTAKQFPDKIAIVDRNLRKTISYSQLLIGSMILARKFHKYDDSYLGIMIPNSAGCVLSVLGAMFSGKTPVMVNYSTGAAENARFAQNKCNFHTIITSRALLEKLECPAVPGMVYIEDIVDSISTVEKLVNAIKSKLPVAILERILHRNRLEDSAVILFTSGSEKSPKAVDLSHRNIASNVGSAQQAFKFSTDDIMLCNLPYFHVFGFMANLWLPLLEGVKLVLYANPLDFKTIVRIIREEKITLMWGTPFFLRGYHKQAEKEDFSSLRTVVSGADKLPAQLREAYAEKFDIEILEGYGVTETSPFVSVNLPGANKHGSIGRPGPGIEVKIIDVDSGKDLPPGEEGKIMVKGDLVMKGYLNDVEETSLKIREGWYETGDMGLLDEDGFLWHRGRLKRFAKIGGEMVSLVKVESTLENLLPEGVSCCVVDLPDARKGAQLIVATDHEIDEKPIVRQLAKELPAIAVPRKFLHFESLPTMGSGKIDFRATTEMVKKKLQHELGFDEQE
jgi:acyl-[acyl-carrier-protein]-phospholipid O-acyltransferase/long-chain-fatty-acid--[acyl-carrier-protein] ligase